MADNQDKLSAKDQQMLEDLEKQLTQSPNKNAAASATSSTSNASQSAAKSNMMDDKEASAVVHAKSNKSIATPPVVKAKTGFLWFFTLLNLMLLAGLMAAAYWAWMQWQQQQQKHSDFFASQESSLAAQQASVAKQQAELVNAMAANQLVKEDWQKQNEAEQQRLAQMASAVEQNSQQISTNLNKINEIADRRPADWLLAEADYLVKVAGRKVWLEQDIATAILMLQAADQRLADLADPSLLSVRQFIADDIETLRLINPVSSTTIALSLKALRQKVDFLPLAFFKKPEKQTAEADFSANADDWKSNLARSWDTFTDKFFTIKKITAEIKPFMSEQQQWLAREQLKFTLLSAQVAIQQHNNLLFKSELEAAQQQLKQYFDSEDQGVKQFTQSVLSLKETDVEQVYPQQLSSGNPLQDVLQRRVGSSNNNGMREL